MRNSAYTFQDFGITDQSVSIDTYKEIPLYIDDADLAQSTFVKQMEMAELQGQLVNEMLESAMLASHAAFTDVGDVGGVITSGSTAPITVGSNNIDDVIRAIKRILRKANGFKKVSRKGMFVVWRPEDFEVLEAFIQANGYNTADKALENGTDTGLYYMGMYHYMSNDTASGHLMAGVRGLYNLGICKSTFGKVTKIQHPAGPTGGNLSGWGMHVRVDYKFVAWNNDKVLLLDLNVV